MVVIASDNFLLKNICIIIYKPMNIIGLFVYFYTRKAHYTGALILMGDLQLCKESCRNRAWLGVNRCVFVAGKRRNLERTGKIIGFITNIAISYC